MLFARRLDKAKYYEGDAVLPAAFICRLQDKNGNPPGLSINRYAGRIRANLMEFYSHVWMKNSGDVSGLCFVTTAEFNDCGRQPFECIPEDEDIAYRELHWQILCYGEDDPDDRGRLEKLAELASQRSWLPRYKGTKREAGLKEQAGKVASTQAELEKLALELGENLEEPAAPAPESYPHKKSARPRGDQAERSNKL
ncbi:hypothetical protein DYH09_04395 [bacterium CPR1]|nr:hypothetical protein [bacterium CPR1]